MRKRLHTLLVFAITIALLALVVRKVGLTELVGTLQNVNPHFLVLAALFTPVPVLISVWKWHLLLKSEGIQVSFWYLFKLYLVGYFFNNFLPSNVGGDVVRSYELGSTIRDQARAVASVFMERMSGFIVLCVLVILDFLINLRLLQDAALLLASAAAIAILVALLWLVVDPRLATFIENTIQISTVQKLVHKFRKFHSALLAYKRRPRALANALLISVLYYSVVILKMYITARIFYAPISLLDISVAAPIIQLVSMLPLTFNGIGVQEWAFVLLFSSFGLPASVGLSTILFIRTTTLMVAVAGGLLYPRIHLVNQQANEREKAMPQVSISGGAD